MDLPQRIGAGGVTRAPSEGRCIVMMEKIRALPAGTKAILVWSAVYTAIVIVTCIYFRNVIALFAVDILFPWEDIGLTHPEAIAFYSVTYGGFIVNGLICCRIWANVEEKDEDALYKGWRLYVNYEIIAVMALLAMIVIGWNRIFGLTIALWFFVPGNLTSLWRFRKLLNLVREE